MVTVQGNDVDPETETLICPFVELKQLKAGGVGVDNINSEGLESLNVFCEFPHPLLFEDAQKPNEFSIRAT